MTNSVHLLFLARQTKPVDGQSDTLCLMSPSKPAPENHGVRVPLTRRASAIQDHPLFWSRIKFLTIRSYIQALLVRFGVLPGSGDPCDCVSAFKSDMI